MISVGRTSIVIVAAALFLAIVGPLKASAEQSASENTAAADKNFAGASLPDVRALLEQQQLLQNANKYQLCRNELEEIIDMSGSPSASVEKTLLDVESQARKLGIESAFADAKAVFVKNSPLLRRKYSFGIAIYSKHLQQRRKVFVVDLLRNHIDSFDIQHGRGDFQNEGRNRSSLGCFIGGVNIKNVAFSLHGFDGRLNSYACERRLQVHISQSWGASRPPSFGCLTLRRGNDQSYKMIAAALSGGGLICAYDEGRVPDRRWPGTDQRASSADMGKSCGFSRRPLCK